MRTRQLLMMILLILSFTLIFFGCDTGGSGGGGGGSKVGRKKIILTGGTGSGGSGGQGGMMTIDSLRSVNIKKSGTANTAFSLPGQQPSYIAGANEMKVTLGQSVFVNAVAPDDAIPAGSYFILYGSFSIQKDNGNGIANSSAQDAVIDSIDIAQGATVTLDMNWDIYNEDADGSNSTGGDNAEFFLDGDLRIAGILTVGLLNSADGGTDDETIVPSSANLQVDARNIFVSKSGKVLARGGDSSTSDGGKGGYIWLGADMGPTSVYSDNGGFLKFNGVCDASGGSATGAGNDGGNSGNCDLYSGGVAINTGTIYSNGGDGENGGYADWSNLFAEGTVYNTGNFYQHGGTGTNGDGGGADWVGIYSENTSVYTRGTIELIGGDGTANGGNVQYGVDIYNNNGYTGVIKIDMNITAAGGNSTSNGNGGYGGYFWAGTYSGAVDVAGSFDGSGGDAAGTDNYGGTGGGGYLAWDSGVETWHDGTLYWSGAPSYTYRPEGNITVSMTFDLSGGDGYYGGSSTGFYIDTGEGWYTESANPAAGETYLIGYQDINLSGGDCSTDCSGGQGGSVIVNTYSEFLTDDAAPFPTGAIFNNVPIKANGGNGDGIGSGANGGYISFSGDGQYNDDTSIVKNAANISLMGGSGGDGGDGGSVYMFGYAKVSNTGILNISGGNGTSNGGYSTDVNYTEFISVTDVSNSGKIIASGGNGDTGDGGGAGNPILMYAGGHVSNSGQIIFSGGDGATSGGNGGAIDIFSHTKATSNTAAISVKGGIDTTDGSADGSNGHIFMDWVDITPADGTL